MLSDQVDPARLSSTIAALYDAALDPGGWPRAMQATCEFVGGSQSLMYWHGATQPDVITLHRFNDDPEYSRRYMEEYAPLNPLFPATIFRPVGSVFAASDIMPDEEMAETRFGREWLLPQKMTGSLGVVLDREQSRAALFTVQWQGRPIPEEARARLALLAPHIQRAVAIGRLFEDHKAREEVLTRTLEGLGAGVFLVGRNGHLVFANEHGQRLLDEARLLRRSAGALRAVAVEADARLRDGLRAVEEQAVPVGPGGVGIPLAEAEEGSGRWLATILPLLDGDRRRAGRDYDAVAAVFVRSTPYPDVTPLEDLARRDGLTASEIRVVDTLLRANGIDGIADALGISRATVKTHLNRIFRKCKVPNQAELIKMIAGLNRPAS